MSVGGSDPMRVFLSYRRDDSIGVAGRIHDRVASQFGSENVFYDVDAIPFGVDFRRHIDQMVADCDVVFVVIGLRWLDAVDEHGERRLDQTGDFVRLEVEAALRREIPVVPLLVDGAAMPSADRLPESIADLAFRNGTQVRHDPDFHGDMDRLLRRLIVTRSAAGVPQTEAAPSPVPPPAARGSTVRRGTPRPAVSLLQGHRNTVWCCAVAPDGSWIVSASKDKSLRIWDLATGKARTTLRGHKNEVNSCAVAPDGTWVVSASDDKTLRIWDVATGTTRRTLEGHTGYVSQCAVAPDGTWIVSTSYDSTVRIWDVAAGTLRAILHGHTAPGYECGVAPDATWIVSASFDGTLRIWDVATGTTRHVLEGHSGPVYGCAVAPDGAWIVSGGGNMLRIWDVATGTTRTTLSGPINTVMSCAVAPDGTWIASASHDNMLRIWDVATGTIRHTLAGHTGEVHRCAVAPDGTWIASASSDKTVRIWDVATGEPVS